MISSLVSVLGLVPRSRPFSLVPRSHVPFPRPSSRPFSPPRSRSRPRSLVLVPFPRSSVPRSRSSQLSKVPRPAHFTNDLMISLTPASPVHQDPPLMLTRFSKPWRAGREQAEALRAPGGSRGRSVCLYRAPSEFFEETRVGDVDILRAGQATRFEFHHRAHVHHDRLRIVFDALGKILAREVLVVRRAGEEGEGLLSIAVWLFRVGFGFRVSGFRLGECFGFWVSCWLRVVRVGVFIVGSRCF